MLDLLEARAQHEGLSIETRVMDGHALDLEDNSFDVVGSQFGVMLFPDMPKGINEMARVVKPGGRVLMNVYGDPHESEFLTNSYTDTCRSNTVDPSRACIHLGRPIVPLTIGCQKGDPAAALRHEIPGCNQRR